MSILDLTKSVFPSVNGLDRNLHTGNIMPTLKGSSKFQQSTVTTFGTRKCLFYNRINHQFIVCVNLCKWCLLLLWKVASININIRKLCYLCKNTPPPNFELYYGWVEIIRSSRYGVVHHQRPHMMNC